MLERCVRIVSDDFVAALVTPAADYPLGCGMTRARTEGVAFVSESPSLLMSSAKQLRLVLNQRVISSMMVATLGRSWGLNHCFKHTPQAILNFVLTIFVVHVPLQSFMQRNLKAAQRIGLTLIALARELFADWVAGGRSQPWLVPRSPPDTS